MKLKLSESVCDSALYKCIFFSLIQRDHLILSTGVAFLIALIFKRLKLLSCGQMCCIFTVPYMILSFYWALYLN